MKYFYYLLFYLFIIVVSLLIYLAYVQNRILDCLGVQVLALAISFMIIYLIYKKILNKNEENKWIILLINFFVSYLFLFSILNYGVLFLLQPNDYIFFEGKRIIGGKGFYCRQLSIKYSDNYLCLKDIEKLSLAKKVNVIKGPFFMGISGEQSYKYFLRTNQNIPK